MSRRFPRLTWLDEVAVMLAVAMAIVLLLGTAEPDRDIEAAEITEATVQDRAAEHAELLGELKFAEARDAIR